jgi:predicted O-methyltransferase YrrM
MRIIRYILFELWKIRAKRKLKTLLKEEDPSIRGLAVVLRETIKRKLDIEEKLWVKNIEQLRHKLKHNHTEVIVTDFGAGTPKSTRTEQEMLVGMVSSSTISKTNKGSKSPFWSLFLHKLIREFKPKTAIELGTCLGISASYQAAALTINGSGKLITMEGSVELVEISKENFTNIGLINIEIVSGRFSDNLLKVLEDNKPIDYIFIDGHHDEKATVEYFEAILPYLSDKAIVVFDDISWSKGMKKAWKTIINSSEIDLVLDLKALGVCLIDKNIKGKKIYKIR